MHWPQDTGKHIFLWSNMAEEIGPVPETHVLNFVPGKLPTLLLPL
jgi:hypothetical protein